MRPVLRSQIAFVAFAVISVGAWHALPTSEPCVDHQLRESLGQGDPYVTELEICKSLVSEDFEFVNLQLRYGRFVRAGDDLEFHYVTELGIKRVVDWGNAEARINEIRKAGMIDYLGMSLLTDSEHEEKRVAGVEHDYPRIYDVVFQTNRADGKVAIMDGGSNDFPYTNVSDEP